ncbi:hypothetical protein FKW77_007975 [Venturia effusa]|uniref:DUF3074 domain-containing protein n=1 Tax=Venturia effusa TaxID=50376 RepID=A0A517LLY2_9PEZI|nr:hypothetical protein FKW77_007975 [Venturia effusa]
MASVQPRYLRLHPLTPSQLPYHAALNNSSERQPSLRDFCATVIDEGRQLSETDLKTNFVADAKTKSSPPAKAPVQILRWTRRIDDQVEYWFARHSEHTDPDPSWDDFVKGLCENHSENEAEYTPDVYDCREVCKWDVEAEEIQDMDGVTLRAVEMCHEIPVVANRVFATLVLTANYVSSPGFIVVQIPLDLEGVDAAIYSNHKNTTHKDSDTDQKKKKVVVGQYASVERCTYDEAEEKVSWDMATAADAKGGIPMFLQKPTMPGKIAVDVGFFASFVEKKRG